jgi:hypothetical protein
MVAQAIVVLVLGVLCMWLELLKEFKVENTLVGLVANNAEPWYRALGINVPVSMASIGMVLAAFSRTGKAEEGMVSELTMLGFALVGVFLRAVSSVKLAVPRMDNLHWKLGVVGPIVCATIVMLIGLVMVWRSDL